MGGQRKLAKGSGSEVSHGFTIVELLVVIVIIAIIALVSFFAMNGLTTRAENTRIKADIELLKKAIIAARNVEQKPLVMITGGGIYGNGGTSVPCNSKPAGTDLAALPKTDTCWVAYLNALNKISAASGVDIRNLVDPLGRPYSIDEEEYNGHCSQDQLWAFSKNYNGWGGRWASSQIAVPLSGFAQC